MLMFFFVYSVSNAGVYGMFFAIHAQGEREALPDLHAGTVLAMVTLLCMIDRVLFGFNLSVLMIGFL